MIATWMFYCLLCAAGLSLTATLAERLLLAGRAAVRVVWVGALLLSLGIPLFAFYVAASAPPPVVTITAASPSTAIARGDVVVPREAATRSTVATAAEPRGWRLVVADRLRAIDATLLVAWAVLSAALAVSLISGVIGLAWMRRRWTERVVQGVTVQVSRRTGPAVVGAVHPEIVIPEWALGLAPEQLSLMLRHELEHLRARDGQLLIAAQIALIAMPWNLALWWQVLRLRVAIEMDCDARVLRVADARSYGELLLEVARPHRSFKLAGMIAFAERATQLERRIRVLKRHRVATSKRATVAASTIALVALSAAWVAPHPVTPLHAAVVAALPSASSLPLVVMRDVAPPAPIHVPVARAADLVRRSRAIARKLPEPCANDTTIVGASFRFLYDGVTLSRENESKACELLTRLVDEQLAEDAVAEASARDRHDRRAAVESQRNAKLMSLLSSDADRATFAANANRTVGIARLEGPMGRGGRGTLAGDSVILTDDARVKLERASQLARGGGRVEVTQRTMSDPNGNLVTRVLVDSSGGERLARLKEEMAQTMSQLSERVADRSYTQLFDGITLSPDAQTLARKMLVEAQQQMSAIEPTTRPGTRLRINRERGFALVVSGADTALVDLASTPADRQRVQSRIRVVPQ